MKKIKIYSSVYLYKHENGTFHYEDTYGKRHEFDSAKSIWQHLTDDGADFDDVEDFIFRD